VRPVVKNGYPFYFGGMPKVSPEHLERRRQQIIEAASRCFAVKGFNGTSMQDIFKESGLSAGAVYRYFPAKADLVSEIAADKQAAVQSVLREMLAREELPPLPEVFHDFLVAFLEHLDVDGKIRLLPEAWAAALHDELVGEVIKRILVSVRGIWTEFAIRYQREGRLPATADPVAVAVILTGLIPGFVLQYLIAGDVTPDLVRQGLEGLFSLE